MLNTYFFQNKFDFFFKNTDFFIKRNKTKTTTTKYRFINKTTK